MFEQVIRFTAEIIRHTGQAVLDTLDARRAGVDDPVDQAIEDTLWEAYLSSSNDNFGDLRLVSSQQRPQPKYDLDQLFLGPELARLYDPLLFLGPELARLYDPRKADDE